MALYRATRTDQPQPGEFVEAIIIAPNQPSVRFALGHMPGVTDKNLAVKKLSIESVGRTTILSTYNAEA